MAACGRRQRIEIRVCDFIPLIENILNLQIAALHLLMGIPVHIKRLLKDEELFVSVVTFKGFGDGF